MLHVATKSTVRPSVGGRCVSAQTPHVGFVRETEDVWSDAKRFTQSFLEPEPSSAILKLHVGSSCAGQTRHASFYVSTRDQQARSVGWRNGRPAPASNTVDDISAGRPDKTGI